jgi:predicted MPP superfamily phosphohydrolase
MIFRLLIAIFSALTICILGYFYLYERIFIPLQLENNSILLYTFITLCTLSLVGFLLIRILPQFIRKFIELIMFTWMGGTFIFFLLCVFTIPVQFYLHFQNIAEQNLSVFIIFFGALIVCYSMFQALRHPKIIHTTIPLPSSIHKNIEELKIVVLSDIHVSGLIGKRRMRSLTQRVNALNPDFIFITGDLMDGSLKQLKKEIEPLKDLKAKKEILYITGNHEYYSGPLNWKKHFENYFKWNILSNSSKIIHYNDVTLNILGIEDKHWLVYEKIPKKQDQRLNTSVEHLRQQRLLNESSLPIENCFNILLAHQPKDAKFLRSYPWIHLQVSGHTHGGQIWPLKYLVKKDQKYNKGLYKIKHNQYIYVNQGTGFWGPPMRLFTRGEITLMKFTRIPQ